MKKRPTKPKHHKPIEHSTPWVPEVRFYEELIPWDESGPVGAVPGQWLEQQQKAFDEWIKKALQEEPLMLGRFFIRNGRVWGVKGPPIGNRVDETTGARSGVAIVALPSYWRGEMLLEKCWLDTKGNLVPEIRGWNDWKHAANAAIDEWNQLAEWEPEIGYIKGESAWGVRPPQNGEAGDWKWRAAQVYEEWQLMEKRRDEALQEREKQRIAKAKAENDGLGWMSPKHDPYFQSLGVTKEQRKVWQFVQEGLGIHQLLWNTWGLVVNPHRFNFGWANITFFNLIKEAFHTSHMLLQWLHERPGSGNSEHDIFKNGGQFACKASCRDSCGLETLGMDARR